MFATSLILGEAFNSSDNAHKSARAFGEKIDCPSNPKAIKIISVLPNSSCIASQVIFESKSFGSIFIISSSITRKRRPDPITRVNKMEIIIVLLE